MKKTNKKVLAATTALASILSAKTSARMNPNLKTGLEVFGGVAITTGITNELLRIFTKGDKWYKGKYSFSSLILDKENKKPDEQVPDKKNKKPNEQEKNNPQINNPQEIESELTEEQKVGLEIFLKKFNGRTLDDGTQVDIYDNSEEIQNFKKILETVFSKVVKGEYTSAQDLSENQKKVRDILLKWIKGEGEYEFQISGCIRQYGFQFQIFNNDFQKLIGNSSVYFCYNSKKVGFVFEKGFIEVQL